MLLSINSDDDSLLSETSTLSSSPTTSPPEEIEWRITEALLQQKFTALGLTDLMVPRHSPESGLGGSLNEEEEDDEYDEDDDDLTRAPLIRSTSLKTGKTPIGRHQKKIVRFADALGLDLESVRYIVSEDLPQVPQSAFRSLAKSDFRNNEDHTVRRRAGSTFNPPAWLTSHQSKHALTPEFVQPGSMLNFMDRVRTQRICLENCMVSSGAGNLSVTCVIRVLNVSFEKVVSVRYTSNSWTTWTDSLASHIPQSNDGWSDKFNVTFSVSATGCSLSPGHRILFAIRFIYNGEEVWDNNMGLNYSLIYR